MSKARTMRASCGECPFDGLSESESREMLLEYPPPGVGGPYSCHVEDGRVGIARARLCFGFATARAAGVALIDAGATP